MLLLPKPFHSLHALIQRQNSDTPHPPPRIGFQEEDTSYYQARCSYSLAPAKQEEAFKSPLDLLLRMIPRLASWGVKIVAFSLVRFNFSRPLENNCLRLSQLFDLSQCLIFRCRFCLPIHHVCTYRSLIMHGHLLGPSLYDLVCSGAGQDAQRTLCQIRPAGPCELHLIPS